MTRVLNFGPGPAAVPLAVLERAKEDLVDYQGTGMSIVEHSHRGPSYGEVHQEAQTLLRKLLGIGDDYRTLFMQGGARGQFALIPMNLLGAGTFAEYLTTGTWSEKALAEAKKLGDAREAINTKKDGAFTRVPRLDELALDPSAAFTHLTSNNTIFGTQYRDFPRVPNLVADMSSDIASRPIDVSSFGLIYAGAQKNLGIAGVTLVIVRDDLVARSNPSVPEIFRYANIAKADSLSNTAPTFAIYMLRNVLAWVDEQGGLEAMARLSREKAASLYGALDEMGGFYRTPVEPESRSEMNVVFHLTSPELEKDLVDAAAKIGIVGIRGHRSVGGIRVSLYNAIERTWVDTLVEFLRHFAQTRG